MAIPNTFTNGSVIDADEHNENFRYVSSWTKFNSYDDNIDIGLIKFSSIIWQTKNGRTTDGGSSWSSGGYGAVAGEDLAAASGANGVAVDQSDGSTSFSSDSGANWSASSTQPPNISEARGISISGSVAILTGLASSGNSIWYSSDGGNNWAQATVDSGAFQACYMFSSTVGFACKSSNEIYKTTDGGANWSDTGETCGAGTSNIIATDATTVYILEKTYPSVQKIIIGGSTETLFSLSGLTGRCSNLVNATNGDICFAFWPTDTASNEVIQLTLFNWDGTNLFSKQIGVTKDEDWSSRWDSGGYTIPNIMEVSNVLYINIDDHIIEVELE